MKKDLSSRPLSSFSYILPWIALPSGVSSFPACRRVVRSVLTNFVNLQKKEKKGKIHIPVIYVDTPVDDEIPFTPAKVDLYLGFVPFFLSPLTMLIRKYGLHRARPICAKYLDFVAALYKNAAEIYRFCMTTTHRPDYRETRQFRYIHRNDPHFLCVPSLHICLVAGCYSYFRELFKNSDFTKQEADAWNSELYHNAVKIAESVLYVKQHSVNCIPAALYMMTILYHEQFTTYDAVGFINDLFADAPDISAQNRTEILDHIGFMYERLLLEGANSNDWRDPIRHWLVSYAKETGQPLSL
jgi:hypothetical protein